MNSDHSIYVVPPGIASHDAMEESDRVLPVEEQTNIGNKRGYQKPTVFGFDSKLWELAFVDEMRGRDGDFVRELNAQLDGLLTFAGLLSSANTAFIVLALGLLSPTPSDQTNDIIRALISQKFPDIIVSESEKNPWKRTPATIASGYFLSTSLACGLLASLGAVFGKQWLANYEQMGRGGPLDRRVVDLQNKMDNQEIYSFHTYLFFISSVIQLAVLLFLCGFIISLIDIHYGIAMVVISTVCLGCATYACAIIVAAWDPGCPFQTPVSMALRTSSLYIKVIIFSRLTRGPPDGHRHRHRQSPTDDTERAIFGKAQSQIISPLSPLDRVLMPFKHLLQPESSLEGDDVMLPAEGIEACHRANAREKAVLWTIENISRYDALQAAAGAITSMHLTEKIDRKGEIPLSDQASSAWVDSPAYARLVFLFQESLRRFQAQERGLPVLRDTIEDVVVFGRAVLHLLISSSEAKEGFERLAGQLSEFSSLAWLKDVDGELKLLLMCSLNHPRFWLYLENLDDSFDTVDISALHVYITSISIASLAETASNRDLWVSRIACRSLSRGDHSARVISLAARSLVHIGKVDQNKMLRGFRDAYSSDTNYVSDVLAAFNVYFVNIETCPSSIEAYAALVKAFRIAVQDLYSTPDDFYAQELRIQRKRQRRDLGKFGSDLLRVLENILIDISDRIQLHTKEIAGKIEFPVPSLLGTHQEISGSDKLLAFHSEILHSIKEGVLDHRWGFELRLSGAALWSAAAVLEPDSITLRVVLDLMRRTEEHQSHYIDLFQFHPSVASIITLSLKSEDPVIRENALSLMRDKAPTWFKEPEINQYFADAELDRSLASHVRLGNTMPNRIVSLVGAVGSTLQWEKKFLDAFHEVVLSTDLNSSSSDSPEMLQLSLDVWYELGKTQIVPGVSLVAANRNWHSDQMLSIITEYVLHRVQFYKTRNSMERMKLANVGTSASLQEYVDQVEQSEGLSQSAAGQKLLQAFKIWTELLSYDT